MTLQQLEYIVALDQYRHFIKAAEHCFVSQPNLTIQIKKLENELGVLIFNRSVSPLQPTKIGKRIIAKSREILRHVDVIQNMVNDEFNQVEGAFTLGIIPTLAPYILPKLLPQFSKKFPQTKLIIQELQTSQLLDRLVNRTLDIAILVTPLDEKGLTEYPLFYEPFLAYLPKEHPLSNKKRLHPADLDTKELLLLEEGHCFRNQMLSICDAYSSSDFSFEYQSGSITTLMELVNQGMGFTLVPELSVVDRLEERNIRRFVQPEPVREVSLVTAIEFSKEQLINNIQDVLLQQIPDRFKTLQQKRRIGVQVV